MLDAAVLGDKMVLKVSIFALLGVAAAGVAMSLSSEVATLAGLLSLGTVLFFALGVVEWAFSGWYKEQVATIKEARKAIEALGDANATKSQAAEQEAAAAVRTAREARAAAQHAIKLRDARTDELFCLRVLAEEAGRKVGLELEANPADPIYPWRWKQPPTAPRTEP